MLKLIKQYSSDESMVIILIKEVWVLHYVSKMSVTAVVPILQWETLLPASPQPAALHTPASEYEISSASD